MSYNLLVIWLGDAIAALKQIHFTDEMLQSPRSMLSGGWKMKLLIIKAMLARADVLLLDEVFLCPLNMLNRINPSFHFRPADESFGRRLSGVVDSIYFGSERSYLFNVRPT